MSDTMADRIRSLVTRHADSGFTGVCLVKRGDEIILHEAYGLAHRGFGIPNTVEIRFDIASVTKTFTAAAILQLIEVGEIALDTRVMPFLDIADTRISDDVTVYHCLTHTSGIGDDADEEAGEDYEALFIDKPNYSIRETADFLPQFVDKEPNFPPGEGVRYNNVAFILLGLVIEKATGASYRDYVRQHVFERAGMTGADFCAMDGVHPHLAEHYKKIEHDDGTVEWRKNIYSYPPIGEPAGGATVTALDLDRFVRAIAAGEILGEEWTARFLAPQVKEKETDDGGTLWNGFALEFKLDSAGTIVRIGKDGINAGVCSMMAYYPTSDTTVVLLTNIEHSVWTMLREIEPLVVG
ncbi:MAG: beta-lactamase family protein [Chloroflexota bacterium]|nr:beta-lactamase family protein [Chloroflexota bacterium]